LIRIGVDMSGIIGQRESRGSGNITTIGVIVSGTKMLFHQTAAPTGWTKDTTHNDKALRLTSGTVGTGGSVAFETAFASVTPTISRPTATSGAVASHTLSAGEIPDHSHNMVGNTGGNMNLGWTHGASSSADSGFDTESTGTMGGGGHTHSFTQPTISIPTSSAINLDVNFVDVIIAEKD
jgi:microcystin-dependent protein